MDDGRRGFPTLIPNVRRDKRFGSRGDIVNAWLDGEIGSEELLEEIESKRGVEAMRDRDEVRRILVECLGKEGGEATPDRLLYAYQALRGLDRGELLRVAEGCGEIEVVKRRYGPWDDRDTVIILRLRSFEDKSDER